MHVFIDIFMNLITSLLVLNTINNDKNVLNIYSKNQKLKIKITNQVYEKTQKIKNKTSLIVILLLIDKTHSQIYNLKSSLFIWT